MKIIALSDSHNKHAILGELPECDILIHAGDWSGMGRESETRNFAKWLAKQKAKHIVIVPGNHEVEFSKSLPDARNWILDECPDAIILIEESTEIEGIKIFGSPITPWFYNWAWNVERKDIKPYWDKIPEGTNIVITHGPPYQILDELHFPDGTPKGEFVGCNFLGDRIKEIKPNLHIFGHIHCGFGQKHIDGTSYYNVCLCDEMYVASNGYTEIDYEKN